VKDPAKERFVSMVLNHEHHDKPTILMRPRT